MHRVIDISLTGHPDPFRVHDDAFDLLRQYLDRARARLAEDPDDAEVIGDIERSIGEKLAKRQQAGTRVFDREAVSAVLEEVGAVDTGSDEPAAIAPPPGRVRRRLFRIREGQQWAGVCTGLAAYAEIDVSAVRWIFVLLGILTAGVFLLAYLVAMFVLPVVSTRQEYLAAMSTPAP